MNDTSRRRPPQWRQQKTSTIPAWFNVLPILMTLLWWFQQKLMPKSEDPQQKQVQRMMQFMPFIFGFMLYSYEAGLALDMTVSSSFGILEDADPPQGQGDGRKSVRA